MYHRHVVGMTIAFVLWQGCATTCAPRAQVSALVQTLYVDAKIGSTGVLNQRGAPYTTQRCSNFPPTFSLLALALHLLHQF